MDFASHKKCTSSNQPKKSTPDMLPDGTPQSQQQEILRLQRVLGNQRVVQLLRDNPSSVIQRNGENGGANIVPLDEDEQGNAPANPNMSWTPDNWDVDANTWTGADNLTGDAEADQAMQFRNDAKIMYQTIFAPYDPNLDNEVLHAKKGDKQKVAAKNRAAHKQRQEFLKRTLLAQAIGGVQTSTKKNPTADELQGGLNMPMASLLAHGQRHLFNAKDGAKAKELARFLVSGNPKEELKKSNIAYGRTFASHGLSRDATGKLVEHKLTQNEDGSEKSKIGQAWGQMGSSKGVHYGIDLPIGGIGNQDVQGNVIGARGRAFGADGKKIKDSQHGHAYINVAKDANAMMLGIEGNAPHKKNMFGVKHDIKSGSEDQTVKKSVTGGQKMSKLLGDAAPNEYGGKQTPITPDIFSALQVFYHGLSSLSEDEQKEFFKRLLVSKPDDAPAIVEETRQKIDAKMVELED